MSLSAILDGAEPLEDGFGTAIPADWHQGRTAYGGFSAALALSAAMKLGGVMPPLRSAQVSFVGPLSGAVTARAKVLRSGRNATWVAAEIAGEGGVGLTATFVFMGPVDSALHLNDRSLPEGLIPVDAGRSSCAIILMFVSRCRAVKQSARKCAGGCGRGRHRGLIRWLLCCSALMACRRV